MSPLQKVRYLGNAQGRRPTGCTSDPPNILVNLVVNVVDRVSGSVKRVRVRVAVKRARKCTVNPHISHFLVAKRRRVLSGLGELLKRR